MLRRAIVVSVVLHIVAVVAVAGYLRFRTPPVEAKIHQVKFLPEPQPTPKEVVKELPKEEPPPEEAPKEPEPPKKEPPPKPKEEPPKPKKEDPPKKPDPPKKKEPPKPKEEPPEKKPDPVEAKKGPIEPGITMKEELPSVLDYWARLVKRSIEKKWKVPAGAKIRAEANTATVSFWVSRDGKLVGAPQIVTQSKDPGVSASAVRAIQQAAPFPLLPDEYTEKEVQVVYTFVPLQ